MTNNKTQNNQLSLYIHIPFCQTKCPYCDFNTYSGIEPLIPSYVNALNEEITTWANVLPNTTINTIFFGGGTPSYLQNQYISSTLETIKSCFNVKYSAEVTMECNPNDVTEEKLEQLAKLGINRLSIGVQSLNNSLLEVLGRRHSALEAVDSYNMARRAGFSNISLDLMYGLPGQTIHHWEQTLNEILALLCDHLSVYCLTLEEGTPMERQVATGNLLEPDQDLAADMYIMTEQMLGKSSYNHYEISNWALDGMESLHNLTYWHNQPYLGVGPGAHSYLGKWRFNNIKSPREYTRRLSNKQYEPNIFNTLTAENISKVATVETVETIDTVLEMSETLMLGLRLSEGISENVFRSRFNKSISETYNNEMAELIAIGLISNCEEVFKLTERGRLLANEAFVKFFGQH